LNHNFIDLFRVIQMSESQHNAIVLRKNNENRFSQLWANFAKS